MHMPTIIEVAALMLQDLEIVHITDLETVHTIETPTIIEEEYLQITIEGQELLTILIKIDPTIIALTLDRGQLLQIGTVQDLTEVLRVVLDPEVTQAPEAVEVLDHTEAVDRDVVVECVLEEEVPQEVVEEEEEDKPTSAFSINQKNLIDI